MRQNIPRGPAAAVLLLGAVLMSGCGGSSSATTPPATPSAPSAMPTDTPSTSTAAQLSPEDQAVAQAQIAVADYYDVLNTLSADPDADMKLLEDVAISGGLVDARTDVDFDRSRDRRQVGETRIASTSVTNVTLQFAPDTTPPTIPTVEFDVCYDVSGVDVLDSGGNSVVRPDRPDTGLARLGVANYDWPEPTGWKIAFSEVKGEPCPDAL